MLKKALILKGTPVEVTKTLEKLCNDYKNCTVERCIIIESSKERMKRRLSEQND